MLTADITWKPEYEAYLASFSAPEDPKFLYEVLVEDWFDGFSRARTERVAREEHEDWKAKRAASR